MLAGAEPDCELRERRRIKEKRNGASVCVLFGPRMDEAWNAGNAAQNRDRPGNKVKTLFLRAIKPEANKQRLCMRLHLRLSFSQPCIC